MIAYNTHNKPFLYLFVHEQFKEQQFLFIYLFFLFFSRISSKCTFLIFCFKGRFIVVLRAISMHPFTANTSKVTKKNFYFSRKTTFRTFVHSSPRLRIEEEYIYIFFFSQYLPSPFFSFGHFQTNLIGVLLSRRKSHFLPEHSRLCNSHYLRVSFRHDCFI